MPWAARNLRPAADAERVAFSSPEVDRPSHNCGTSIHSEPPGWVTRGSAPTTAQTKGDGSKTASVSTTEIDPGHPDFFTCGILDSLPTAITVAPEAGSAFSGFRHDSIVPNLSGGVDPPDALDRH